MIIRNMNNYYLTKINKAIDYIEENLNKKITTKDLAKITAFSEFHFHRIFKSITNETVNQYIKRLKMGKSYRDLVTSNETITSIAFDYGFNSSANFSRDFRNYYKNSPFKMRKDATYSLPDNKYLKKLKLKFKGFHNISEIEVIYIRIHTGYNTKNIKEAFSELLQLIKINKIKYHNVRSIGIGYDDPDFVDPDKCRYDACISLKDGTNIDCGNLNRKKIASGKYAAYLFEGENSDFSIAWDFIIKTWMSDNKYLPDNKPHFEEYLPSLNYKKGLYKAKLYLPITEL